MLSPVWSHRECQLVLFVYYKYTFEICKMNSYIHNFGIKKTAEGTGNISLYKFVVMYHKLIDARNTEHDFECDSLVAVF